MAHEKDNADLTELLLQCAAQQTSWLPKCDRAVISPFSVTERKRSKAALMQVVQEAFVQDVSTRKMEKPAQGLGIEASCWFAHLDVKTDL